MNDRLRKLNEDTFDVVVIGAGPGGLASAALLAARGKKVLVVDQHYVPGGNMSSFTRKKYEFDVGVHYLGGCHPDGMITRILRASGAGDVTFEPMDPDGFDTIVLPDLTFKVPRGVEAYRARLLEVFPHERKGIERYVSLLRQILLMQGTLGNPLSIFTALPRSLMLLRWMRSTYAEFLDSCTQDKRLRAVLGGQHANYALPPSRASVLAGAGITVHYLESGAWFPRGGGQAMADSMAAAIERNGGKILLRTHAKRILVEKGRVQGVTISSHHLGERTIRAPIVISNADLKRTMNDLVGPEHLKAKTVARTRAFEMAPALGILYLGIDRDLRAEGFPRTNLWVQPELDVEKLYAANERGEMPDDPFVYVSVASVKDPGDPRVAPPGRTNLQVMSVAPCQPEAWGVSEADVASGAYQDAPEYVARKERYGDTLLRAAARTMPGLESSVVYREVATPLTHRRYVASSNGTSYGIAATPAQFMDRRPDAKTEIRGLYLCGASCRMGHGIAGTLLSGMMAAANVAGSKVVREVMGPANAAARHAALPAAAPHGALQLGE